MSEEKGSITFGELVDLRTAERSDAIAVDSVESGPHTWAELQEASVRYATALASIGVSAREPVLTMMPADFEGVALWAACARLGAIEVPVNHAYRGVWLSGIIERIGARVAVIDEQFWPNWETVVAGTSLEIVIVDAASPVSTPPGIRCVPFDDLRHGRNTHAFDDPPRADDVGAIMHTSGTTGPSKGVVMPWTAMWFRVNQHHLATVNRSHDTVFYAPFGPFHWAGRGRWYEMACFGTRLVTRHQFKTDAWLHDVRAHGCTATTLVGAMARFVHNSPEQPDDADNPLRLVSMGPVVADVDRFKERFGVEVAAAYNMTEIPFAFVTLPPHVVTNETSRSCGVPHPSVPIRVVGSEGQLVGPGEVGELLIGGDRSLVNAGYYNMPAETERAWRDGWFHTGDLFRYDDQGRYYLVDRAKDALRRRGENISSMEIESILNEHPAVAECAVIGVPSEWGEDEVKAVVVVAAGAEPDPADLIAFLRPQIAEFAVPRYVEYVAELPKTATLRVRKMVLRDAGVTPTTWDRLQTEPGGVTANRAPPIPSAEDQR